MGRGGSGKGGQLLLLLLLLGILAGAGTWNYRRNLAAQNAEVRPYRTLSDADLQTLTAAYESEVAQLSKRYEAARRQRSAAPAAGGDRFQRFEKAQQRGRAERELGYRVSEREAALDELHEEQRRRAAEGKGWQRILKLVFTFQA